MKQLIHRVRTTDRRLLAVNALLLTLFGAANYGISKLVGLLVDVHDGRTLSDAGTSGYVLGFLMAFVFVDVIRRAKKIRDDRLVRSTAAAAE